MANRRDRYLNGMLVHITEASINAPIKALGQARGKTPIQASIQATMYGCPLLVWTYPFN